MSSGWRSVTEPRKRHRWSSPGISWAGTQHRNRTACKESTPTAVLDASTAVVTGAGRGIGQAIAETISSLGATVIAADLDESNARRVADGLSGDAAAIPVDVT